jgi:precorrin-2/cobalt-factor-2 C20-methyltransferase
VKGILYGIGVGPGDPELITLKALRILERAALVAYIVSPSGTSTARRIASPYLGRQQELPIVVPMSRDRRGALVAYDAAAREIAAQLEAGRDVAVLCEGDPLFYGSFIYLYERLGPQHGCEVVPGITAFTAAAARARLPLTRQDERLAVLTSRSTDEDILAALQSCDSVVIMKAGPARERILPLLKRADRYRDTVYLERVGWDEEQVWEDLDALPAGPGPYFSLFITARRRP